jgi:hypothetical protein
MVQRWNAQELTLARYTTTETCSALEGGQIVSRRDAIGSIFSKTNGTRCRT